MANELKQEIGGMSSGSERGILGQSQVLEEISPKLWGDRHMKLKEVTSHVVLMEWNEQIN